MKTFFTSLLLCFGLLAFAQCPAPYTLSATTPSRNSTTGTWTVPAGGPYKIKIIASGAKGGISFGALGGNGATMQGEFTVASGQTLNIVAGAPGADHDGIGAAGGGGGTGVRIGSEILIVAGGGGGGAADAYDGIGYGQGGLATNTGSTGGIAGLNSGGGGGFTGNGGDVPQFGGGGTSGFDGVGGIGGLFLGAFGGGGVGGGGGSGYGGGGNGGGGGGGYSGGNGGGHTQGGRGGGSINNGTNQTNTAGANAGGGSVTIECLGVVIPLSFVVTNTNDAGPGSLRQAILDANTDPDANTITFQSGVTGTITLLSALPQITAPLTVSGPGAGMLTISGNNAVSVFELNNTSLTLNSITIADGKSFSVFGSGVLNSSGTLIVNNCTFSNNNAYEFGGAIFSDGNLTITNSTFINNNSSNSGGAIWALGVNTISNCTFTNNRAQGGGAIDAAGGTLNITGSTFKGNSATNGSSGAIYNRNSATITNSTFTGNSAASVGGAFFNNGSQLTVTNCTITNNTGGYAGGGAIGNGANGPLTLINTIIAGNPGINMNTNYGSITDGGNNIKDDA